ncbi:nitroreductase [Nocardioides thalensis]|uniref:Nitroreductase n=1 Tax=Nocardioides thalensis TaxID=1914755 RepID=A0A853C618_9ACTN|nr:nitroreductase family protein [Nocardioides thalensis]NYJ02466.1 nitroreductase [Nocardioides thalensis]
MTDDRSALDGLHPLLRARYSPVAFDPAHRLAEADVALLLEAARWAPSAGNSQPWAFVAARREDPTHARLSEHLAPSSRGWATSASALVVNIVHRHVDDSDLLYSAFADYDLGQAVAHMTLQAQAMGLACRQFRAFDLGSLSDELCLAPGWEVMSMTAIGRSTASEPPGRVRRDPADLRTRALRGSAQPR